MRGVSLRGVDINNLRYADDTSLMAESISNLRDLVITVNEKGKPHGMELTSAKQRQW